jgi:WS/DGAT/MGAT family acyltransferase
MPSRMTDAEALMWSVEQDPRLRSTMGAIVILDGPPDLGRLRNTIVRALPNVPALRERVQPSGVPLVPPERVLDRHLDLDHHLRVIRLPGNPSMARLEEAACRIVNDPFDRDRPLWQMTVVTGLPRRRAALVVKLHHSVADGQGALGLAASLLEFQADAPPPDPVDPAEVLAALAEASPRDPSPASLGDSLRFGAERVAGFLNEAANALANPQRAAEAGAAARHLADQLPTSDEATRSPLWSNRSGNRRLATLAFPLAGLKRAASDRDMKVNELFVTACADAALTQHDRAGVDLPEVHTSMVISTRSSDDPAARNAVVPVPLALPGTGSTGDQRLIALRAQVQTKREEAARTSDALGTFGVVANLLPASVAATLALQQTGKIDIATSNLPGPAIPLWIAGRRIRSLRPVGPVAGTACNATLLSTGDEAAIGLHVDPATGIDVDEFRSDLRSALTDLGVTAVPR